MTCDATTVLLDGGNSSIGANYTYEWFNTGNVSVGTDLQVNVTEVGTYTFVVTDMNNGCTASATTEVIPDENLPDAIATVSDQLTCSTLSLQLDGSASSSGAGINYLWLDEFDNVISFENNTIVTNPGTYTLIVTDSNNGCTAASSIEVVQNIEPPTGSIAVSDIITCQNPTVTIEAVNFTGFGSLTYEWINPVEYHSVTEYYKMCHLREPMN